MQHSKKLFIIIIAVFFFANFSLPSEAIGVRNCGPYYYDYAPYKDIEFHYEVLRAEYYDTQIEGPFAENYKIDRHDNLVTGMITLPPGFNEPGTHLNAITFVQQVGNLQGTAVAVAAVRCPIYIEYPYPGKYLLFDASIRNVNENEKANVSVIIESKGDEPVRNTNLVIEIGKASTTEVVHSETFPLILPSEKISKTSTLRTESLKPGIYEMRAVLSYEQESISVSRQFRVGSLDINVLEVTREVNQSPFTRIRFRLENNWNNEVRNVYAVYRLHNEDVSYGPQRSPSVDLNAFESQWVESIIETQGIMPGNYFISYEIHFDDNMRVGISPITILKPEESSSLTMLLIAIGMMLTLVIVLSIVLLRRFHKDKEEGKPKEEGKRKKK